MFKKIIRKFFNALGFDLVKKGISSNNNVVSNKIKQDDNSMSHTLIRLKNIGLNPSTIVDIGAASGNWAKEVNELWKEASIVAFEPIGEQVERLKVNTVSFANKLHLFQAVAGDQNGEIDFSITDDPDGSGVYGDGHGKKVKMPMITIDTAVEKLNGPFLIKLDTHGFEFPILKGAEETLKQSDAVIIEVYGFYVSPTAPLFHQLSSQMEKYGFRLFDIVDIMRRKKDGAFWQADAIYLKNNHTLFLDNNYR